MAHDPSQEKHQPITWPQYHADQRKRDAEFHSRIDQNNQAWDKRMERQDERTNERLLKQDERMNDKMMRQNQWIQEQMREIMETIQESNRSSHEQILRLAESIERSKQDLKDHKKATTYTNEQGEVVNRLPKSHRENIDPQERKEGNRGFWASLILIVLGPGGAAVIWFDSIITFLYGN